MLVAIYWQQLPIQIVVADSVADSKTTVRIGDPKKAIVVSKVSDLYKSDWTLHFSAI